MSASIVRDNHRGDRNSATDPRAMRILEWSVAATTCFFLLIMLWRSWGVFPPDLAALAPWLLVVILAELLTVPIWGGIFLSMSIPILLAAGMVFAPVEAGLLAFLGTTDRREFWREVTLGRAVYNRSQISLATMAASFAFHGLGGTTAAWPTVLLVASVAVLVDLSLNTTMVVVGMIVISGMSMKAVLLRVFGDSPSRIAIEHLCFGLVAVLLAEAFRVEGSWSLAGFFIPAVLARQMFLYGRRFSEATGRVEEKSKALQAVTESIVDERRDERLAVAGDLHDEVLPPLYQVHLMGQVLRQDLAMGRLLDLEDDLPELLRATDHASAVTRGVIRDLRRSSLGPDGLCGTLRLLVRSLEEETPAKVQLDLADVDALPMIELVIYQVAREALRNAVSHSGAEHISLVVRQEGDGLLLTVIDDGDGFDLDAVDGEAHFGLQLMRDRMEAVGGILRVESVPGVGTSVVARVPAGASR